MAGQYDSLGFNVPRKPDPPVNAIDAAKGTFHEKDGGYDPLANELYYGNAPGQAEADLQRARGKAEAATQRGAYQTNLQGFNQSRGHTMGALDLQRQAALGEAPSRAEIAGKAAMDRSLQQQVAAAGSVRGGPSATAASYRNASQNAAGQRAQMTQGIAAERAGEMATARQAYGQTALGSQAQDLGAAGLQQQSELQQRQLNQGAEQFYENQGQRARETELEANLRRKEAADRRGQEGRRLRAAESSDEYNRSKDIVSTIVGGAGGVLGSIFSDERAKMPVLGGLNSLGQSPVSAPAPASFDVVSPGGGMNVLGSLKAHGDFGTRFQSQPGAKPMFSDMGAKAPMPMLSDMAGKLPMASDERAKEVLPLYEPEGKQLRVSEDGRGYLASISEDAPTGASLSGPVPKYSKSAPAPKDDAKPSKAKPKPKQERDLSKEADEMLAKERATHEARMAQGPAVDPMAAANRSMEASPYAYKPEFTPPEQQSGEPNVGPMAQTMAADPVAGTAVRQDPQSGMLTIDRDKGLKVVMGGLASLQKQLDAMQSERSTPKRRK